METINFWLSFIFATAISFFFGMIFDWGTLKFLLCAFISWIVLYVMGMVQELVIEQEAQIAIEEAENRELINKALKHYAETQGIK